MMKVLIDTHIALWALMDDPKMPKAAEQILMDENNDIYYSTASVWEVAIKHCIRPDDMIVDAKLFENDPMLFKLHSEYQPTGDQPQAITELVEGFQQGN